ncbi:tripartite tricarboxylate transporter substrate binding protein [Thioalbus denitrificans]|uniref:Tripartite-type tricarboxylate transporter receptor subunit TctC n=1 Tax=Thioalbus denitrificans TaxID=547122 RepID=A0A369CEQ7_9GAMM|nr:tripartite tricarboxylate transporter substrate binding protein [Thioalbus denitrificans]RCX31718.1 tripartite-type tricarboxylate transporter receptor subunit TctC [Thioalbus denitrificans]
MSDWNIRGMGFGGILAVLLCLPLSTSAGAEDGAAAEFFRGQVVRLVVGYGPGGGYDTLARLLAPWIERRTGATVVVENRPGGGGLVALSQVYRSAPDGLTLMLVNGPGAALAQLLELEGARYDLGQVPWLARVSTEPSVVMLSGRSPLRNLAGLRAAGEPVKWSGGGKADALADTAACLSEALGLEAEIIIGYKGSKEAALAAMRGEVDGIVTSDRSALKYARGGQLVPIAVLDRDRSPLFPDLPTLFEAVELSAEQAWWIDFRARMARTGRALLTTPGTPADRVAYLAGTLGGILADPAFVAEASAKGFGIDPAGPDTLAELVTGTIGALEGERLVQVRHVLLEKYYR